MIAHLCVMAAAFGMSGLAFLRHAPAGFRPREPLLAVFFLGASVYAASIAVAAAQLPPAAGPAVTQELLS